MVLSHMLRKNNTLRHLHCDMNRIYLQGFSAIVNALEHNTSILYLPRMEWDRAEQTKALQDHLKATNANHAAANITPPQPTKSSFLHRKGTDSGGKKERRVSISEQPWGAHTAKAFLKPTFGRQLSTVGEEQGGSGLNLSTTPGSAPHELLKMLEERWEAEVVRLDELLQRNNLLNRGGTAVDGVHEEFRRETNNNNYSYSPVMITA